jgi:hypothetical protein
MIILLLLLLFFLLLLVVVVVVVVGFVLFNFMFDKINKSKIQTSRLVG